MIFTGANKHTCVADYNRSSKIVAYGAAHNVALWNPKSELGVYATLQGHTKEVTAVRFIPDSPYLISAAADHQTRLWENIGDTYTLNATFSDHSGSVTCAAAAHNVFATGSADGTIVVRMGENFTTTHTTTLGRGIYPTFLALQEIERGTYVLAVGGTSADVHVLTITCSGVLPACTLRGHEDWVKCLAFVEESPGSFLLASGAQDRYVRLWRMSVGARAQEHVSHDPLALTLLQNKVHEFSAGAVPVAMSFEALIMGHDDWVMDMEWNRGPSLRLLTCAADTALMVWEMDTASGVWVCSHRLGEMSIKGASTATGSAGGFWSCLWVDDLVIACGKTGSFRVYKNDNSAFESVLGVTGPAASVTDVCWDPTGQYLLATSSDQTTRLIGEYNGVWREMARPQIHGYDMVCVAPISSTRFVSGGDEKVLRVFEMTASIASLLKRACGIEVDTAALPEAAAVPVLGLSNKADNENDTESEDILGDFSSPPLEDYLQRFTLFPEIDKLYGHGYEITCCAVSVDGLVASACRSNTAKHAVVRLYDAHADFVQLPHALEGHTLTITSLAFSPDGKHLLVVSRDRQLSLWRVDGRDITRVCLIQAHSRIIWDCAWVSNEVFITGSRDKHAKMWRVANEVQEVASVKCSSPVTSVAAHGDLIAVGLETGAVSLYTGTFNEVRTLDNTPVGRVNKLAFSGGERMMLGIAGSDNSIRICDVA